MVMDALYGSNYNNSALVSASSGRGGTGASEWTHGSWKVGRRDFDDVRPSSRSRPRSEMSFRSNGEVGLHKNLDELGPQTKTQQYIMPVVAGPPTRGRTSVPIRDTGEKLVCENIIGRGEDEVGPQQLIFYADTVPMEGRTVLNQSSNVSHSPPHPSLRFTQKLHHLHPKGRIPKRVQMLNERGNLPDDPLPLLEVAIVRSLEKTCRLLADECSASFSGRLSEGYFEMIMGRLHFPIDQCLREMLSLYGRVDAGIDARKCASDLKECALNPAAQVHPVLVCVIASGLALIARDLETRWKIHDMEFCEGARDRRLGIKDEPEIGHVDPVQFKTQLDRCGLLVDAGLHIKLLHMYGAREGPYTGFVHYPQFLSDLRTVSQNKYGKPAAIAAQMLFGQSLPRPTSPPAVSRFTPDHGRSLPQSSESLVPRKSATATFDARSRAREPAVFLEPQLDRLEAAPTQIPIWKKKERPSSKGSVTFYDGGGKVDPEDSSPRARSPLTSLGGSAISTPMDSPIGTRMSSRSGSFRGFGQGRSSSPSAARPSSAQLQATLAALVDKAVRGEKERPAEEKYMRTRLQGVINNIDIIKRQLESIDIRRTHMVTRAAFVEILAAFAFNLTRLDVEWMMAKFGKGKDLLAMKDLFAWCTPMIKEDLPPRAKGRIETGSCNKSHMLGPVVSSQFKDGLNGYQPAAARKTLRIPEF